jgi:drug/metabolite transporter (DMT)-like permease
MGIQLMIVAALFVAASNLCMRRSIDAGGSSRAFLMIQLTIVFFVAVLLNPVRTGDYHWSPLMPLIGVCGGILFGMMMICLGKSLEFGPPGLTFAVLNSSTVMPMIFMVLFFGASFGYVYSPYNGAGSLLVVIGLFWAGRSARSSEKMFSWAACIISAFVLDSCYLTLMQWRGLLLHINAHDANSQWFMPAIFFTAALIQICTQKRRPNRHEVAYGVLGGIAKGFGVFFMIWATEASTPLEHAMLFPVFSVSVIVTCNLWGQWLYKEKVNWLANALCVIGLLIGALDWNVLFS